MPATKPRLVEQRRSPQREELARAIDALRRAERAEQANRAGLERADDLVLDAKARLSEARSQVDKAREADAKAVGKALKAGTTPASNGALQKARRAEEAAADHLASAETARDDLKRAVPELDGATKTARQRVEQLANAVIKSEVPAKRLIEEAEAATAALIEKRLVLRVLLGFGNDLIVDEEQKARVRRVLGADMPGALGSVQFQDWSQHPVSVAFAQMRQRLAADADALCQCQFPSVDHD